VPYAELARQLETLKVCINRLRERYRDLVRLEISKKAIRPMTAPR
jgi:hypothetical protein